MDFCWLLKLGNLAQEVPYVAIWLFCNNICNCMWGNYSGEETIQRRKLLIIRNFWLRKLFKGGKYSREETIWSRKYGTLNGSKYWKLLTELFFEVVEVKGEWLVKNWELPVINTFLKTTEILYKSVLVIKVYPKLLYWWVWGAKLRQGQIWIEKHRHLDLWIMEWVGTL